ncbi:MAG: hypothetical protein JNL01_03310 [Bdellovibrionales bacterium]|nr:hypothetical protein [Bdellovibrionales bacterium]
MAKSLVISTWILLESLSGAYAQAPAQPAGPSLPTPAPMTCTEYEKTVSDADSWVLCNVIDTRVTSRFSPIADIYITPEVDGERYAAAWMGATGDHPRVTEVSTILAPEKLDRFFVSKRSLEFFFKRKSGRVYRFDRFSVSAEEGRSAFDPFAYYSNASAEDEIEAHLPKTRLFGGFKYRNPSKFIEVQCRQQPPAHFEDMMAVLYPRCTSGMIDSARARECQAHQLWKKFTALKQISDIPQKRLQKSTIAGKRVCTLL